MSNLSLHAGGWTATLDEVQNVPVPAATATYHPGAYGQFIAEVRDHLPRFGLEVTQERYGLARAGQRMFGVLTLAPRADLTRDASVLSDTALEGFTLALGIRSSYDHQFARGLVLGTNVFVCDNLAFSGEFGVNRKNTKNADAQMGASVYEMFMRAMNSREGLVGTMRALQSTPVSRLQAHDVLVQALKAKAITNKLLPTVLREWERPRHPEFKPRNAWSLYNAFTEAHKVRSPQAQMETGGALLRTFRDAFSIN